MVRQRRRRRDVKAIAFAVGIAVFLITVAVVFYENLGRDGPSVVEVSGPSGRVAAASDPVS
jgi:hypothetical protein